MHPREPLKTPYDINNFDEQYHEVTKRILEFDPTQIFKNIAPFLNPFKRWQNQLAIQLIFPQYDTTICACGCERKLTGRKKRWATDACNKFALDVYWIIQGQIPVIKFYLQGIGGNHCFCCGDELTTHHQVDHIIPVHKGGGACWLSNYQLLNLKCHMRKTRIDLKK